MDNSSVDTADVYRFLRYPAERDVVFVFGAGASAGDGAPLQNQIVSLLLFGNDGRIEGSTLGQAVKQFILDHFCATPDSVPTLESVFGYLDYFVAAKESLGGQLTLPRIAEIREALIKLIHYAIGSLQDEGRGIYTRFWEAARKHSLNIALIPLNYDTLVDEAFDFLYPSHAYIDYCIHFMNYDCYDKLHDDIGTFNWWINPREPVRIWRAEQPHPIKLIKLHGSLNWKYCRTCRQVLLTPWDAQIDLNVMGFTRETGDEGVAEEFRCPLDRTSFDTLILPPTHIKELAHPVVVQLRDEAARELRVAKKIVFVGYSFPDADVHLKALLRKSISPDAEIVIVDPHIDKAFRSRYLALSRKAIFIEDTFESALDPRRSAELF